MQCDGALLSCMVMMYGYSVKCVIALICVNVIGACKCVYSNPTSRTSSCSYVLLPQTCTVTSR